MLDVLQKLDSTSNAEPTCCADPERPKKTMGEWINERMSAGGVDSAYLGWRLRDFGIEKNLDWAAGGFFMCGVQGSGKSCLASAIVRDRLYPTHSQTLAQKFSERGEEFWTWPENTLRWFNVRELCDHIRNAWGEGGEEKAISALTKYRVVVIDDIGTERGTANQNAVSMGSIRRVIDKLIHNDIGLVVTSNLAPADMDDPRLGSRLKLLQEIVMPVRDYRSESAKKRPAIIAKPRSWGNK